MRLPPKLDALRLALYRRGVPSRYAHRLLAELVEHHADLTEQLITEGASPDAAAAEAERRIGDAATLADAAVFAMRNASWTTRHPVLSLVLLPMLSLPIAWASLLLAVAWINGMLSPSFRVGDLPEHARTLLSLACVACTYVIPAAASAAFWLFLRHQFVAGVLRWIPPLVIAAGSSLVFVRAFTADPAPVMGRLVVGVNAIPDPMALLLPLVATLSLELWRARRESTCSDTEGAITA